MKTQAYRWMIVGLSCTTLALVGCEDDNAEDVVEDAGESIEDTAEDVGDSVEDAVDDLGDG